MSVMVFFGCSFVVGCGVGKVQELMQNCALKLEKAFLPAGRLYGSLSIRKRQNPKHGLNLLKAYPFFFFRLLETFDTCVRTVGPHILNPRSHNKGLRRVQIEPLNPGNRESGITEPRNSPRKHGFIEQRQRTLP